MRLANLMWIRSSSSRHACSGQLVPPTGKFSSQIRRQSIWNRSYGWVARFSSWNCTLSSEGIDCRCGLIRRAHLLGRCRRPESQVKSLSQIIHLQLSGIIIELGIDPAPARGELSIDKPAERIVLTDTAYVWQQRGTDEFSQ